MVDVHAERGCSVLGVEQVPPEETFKYGVIRGKSLAERLWDVEAMVEKPKPEEAPSNIAVVGRYILNPAIFEMIERLSPGAGGEYQLTDAIVSLLARERVVAYEFEGTRYDCGSKLGYLQATVEYGRRHPELAEEFTAYLRDLKF
jgi:UTP--glucose-1-phosphate uridylyltransferase